MTKTRQLGISWQGNIVSCSGANYPSVLDFLYMEGLFATGWVFPRETGRGAFSIVGARQSVRVAVF